MDVIKKLAELLLLSLQLSKFVKSLQFKNLRTAVISIIIIKHQIHKNN